MKLKKQTLERRESWQTDAGKYKGEIAYDSDGGRVEMNLSPEVSEALLLCIGETIVKFSAKAAEDVCDSLIDSVEQARNPKSIEA